MRQEGYEVVQSKMILKFRAQGQERFTRSRTLGADYTLEALQERIGKTQLPRRKKKVNLEKDTRINLLMDIQARLQGRGPGMERWMKIHNLKEAAKTLNYLTEHGITEYDVLVSKAETASADFEAVSTSIKQMEHRMEQIAALKTHIINYAKTRNTYLAYRKTKAADKPAFRAAHETDLLLHEAAKRAFDAQGVKKLPTVKVLQAEYTDLLAKKKKQPMRISSGCGMKIRNCRRSSQMWTACFRLSRKKRKNRNKRKNRSKTAKVLGKPEAVA